jgi:PRTRC genetic system protein E
MFAAIAAIARDTALTFTVTAEADRLHVIIAGKGDKPRAFAQPVRVTGTPEELDAELPAQLAAYAAQVAAPATAIALPAPTAEGKSVTPKPAARKVAAKKATAPKPAPRATKSPKSATKPPKAVMKVNVRAPKPAKADAPRADLPGKPECLADLRALQTKHGAKLTRRKFIKEAATGRRYEKLWKNFEAFCADGAQGELPMEPATAATPVTTPPAATTHVALDANAAWPFPEPINAAAPAGVESESPTDSARTTPVVAAPDKPRVVGPRAGARPIVTTEESHEPDRDPA